VCIAVHDAEYLRLKSEWKQKVAAVHPDRTGGSFAFRQVQAQRDRWERLEQAWYAKHGLTPPETSSRRAIAPHASLMLAASHRVFTKSEKVRAYLQTHPDARNRDIASALGVAPSIVSQARSRAVSVSPIPKYTQRLAALLSDGDAHSVVECQSATSKHALVVIVSRLRERGFDIVYERRGRFGSYRLVAPPSRLQELI
jgi:GNAT superfamily N-acetyltransferase